MLVVSPSDTGIRQARAKTDRLDARTLARLLAAGSLDGVWLRIVNRLRWHLLELRPELERSCKCGSLSKSRALDRVERGLRKLPVSARVRVAREQVRELRKLSREIEELHFELRVLVSAHRPQLLAELGCGALTAAILIGHTVGNECFRS